MFLFCTLAGEKIDGEALTTLLDEFEGWMWENTDGTSLADLSAKNKELRERAQIICADFITATEIDRLVSGPVLYLQTYQLTLPVRLLKMP